MKRLALLALMGFILVNTSIGCTAKKDSAGIPKKEGKVVATVNGIALTEEDLTFRPPAAHGGRMASGDQPKALEDLINEELIYQQGLKIGLDKDPGYQARIARIESQLAHAKRAEMMRRVYNTQVAAKIEVSHQDAKKYYDEKINQITADLHLGVLPFSNKEGAEEVLKKIRGGASFESIARSAAGSQVSAGRAPWDLGFLSWDQIPADFLDAVYQLKPGVVSEVVSSKRTGYQIFKLFGIRKNPKADFTAVSGVIMNRLRDKKVLEAYEQYVAKLRKEAKIEKF